jgi:hypothetical protein
LGSIFCRLLLASSLLVTIIAWHADAIAAQLTLTSTDNSTDEQGFSIERSVAQLGRSARSAQSGPA